MRALASSVAVAVILVAASCRAPTQVRVIVKSDACTTTSSTSITTGNLGDIETKPPGPSSSKCNHGEVGSLVLQPSGDNDAAFAFKVVMGIDKTADQCTAPDYKGCIVARRALTFLPHEELDVVVDMRASCKDNPCDPQTTCVRGKCVSAQIDPSDCQATCTEPSVDIDAGADSGSKPEPSDGGDFPTDDGSIGIDAPPTSCLPLNSECPVGSQGSYCCPGTGCTGSSFGWRCCSPGPCKVGGGGCCDLDTCVDDGLGHTTCQPR